MFDFSVCDQHSRLDEKIVPKKLRWRDERRFERKPERSNYKCNPKRFYVDKRNAACLYQTLVRGLDEGWELGI